jgi:N-succinyldiaminopimelate aminotransferase
MSPLRQPYLSSRLQGFGTSIFTEITLLAQRHGALNLGQGFPDFDGPEEIKEAAIAAIRGGANQYLRSMGLPVLNAAIAAHERRFYGLQHDPDHEITVTSGATEAICATLLALCETGDEVLIFEPFYDSYRPCIAMAGAVEKRVLLSGPGFGFDPAELSAAVTAKTRLILLNSPHNPLGKVFSRQELEQVAELCLRHDLICVTDEVYEHLVFAGEHLPIACLPGMAERTVKISSTGKTFSFTGWKIGYTCAPAPLSAAIRTAHQFITFCNSGPFQPAMALGLGFGDDFYTELREDYRRRRDLMANGLREAGFGVDDPAGTYFIVADIRPLGWQDDVAFCRMLPEKVGIAAIPASAFYVDKAAGRHLVRFAFCKNEDVLRGGIEKLKRVPRGGDAR